MIQRPMVNFRGQNALLMMAEDGNAKRLRDLLEKLGFFVSRCDMSSEAPQTDAAIACAGLIIVDTDQLESPTVSLLAGSMAPVIALIGHESPSRLQRALEIEPFSVLMKPVGNRGVFTSLFFAFNAHRRHRNLHDELSTARERIGSRRVVVKAILRLMETEGFDDEEAYRRLRQESMRSRVSVEELSARIVARGQDRQRDETTGALQEDRGKERKRK